MNVIKGKLTNSPKSKKEKKIATDKTTEKLEDVIDEIVDDEFIDFLRKNL